MIPQSVLKYVEKEGCGAFVGLEAPRPTAGSIAKCRGYCEENLCGHHSTNWGCPPYVGTPEECVDLCNSYDSCTLVTIPFDCDPEDEEAVESTMARAQGIGREIKRLLLDEGIDALVLADGPCQHCGRCAALDGEPCRHPERRVPSVSAFGILVNDYLERVGIAVNPERMCLYCFALTRDRTPL
ncbi:MAG: DUF2284 domain-containing protein [Thermoplasmatales archaeon]|nr:DUF2284 domain-containing protein [Thermoplasmatales archaeon]